MTSTITVSGGATCQATSATEAKVSTAGIDVTTGDIIVVGISYQYDSFNGISGALPTDILNQVIGQCSPNLPPNFGECVSIYYATVKTSGLDHVTVNFANVGPNSAIDVFFFDLSGVTASGIESGVATGISSGLPPATATSLNRALPFQPGAFGLSVFEVSPFMGGFIPGAGYTPIQSSTQASAAEYFPGAFGVPASPTNFPANIVTPPNSNSPWVEAAVIFEPATSAPVAGVTITSPTKGQTIFTPFALSLTVSGNTDAHGGGDCGGNCHQVDIVPRAEITPQSTISTGVSVSYSNGGGPASGTLTVCDLTSGGCSDSGGCGASTPQGGTCSSFSVTDFQGSESRTLPLTLGLGAHMISARLDLSNSAGSSSQSTSVSVRVSSTIDSIASLSFKISGGPAQVTYYGQLTARPGGDLVPSAAVFTNLQLPKSVSSGQSLVLKEPIRAVLDSSFRYVVILGIQANHYTQEIQFTIN